MTSFGPTTEGTEVVQAFAHNVKDRTFLITGPSATGIGSAAAYALAAGSPKTIILIARSQTRCQPVIDKIHDINASTNVKFVETELDSMASVRKAATMILADPDITAIDGIINNAGIITNDVERTVDGFEIQFSVNHLSHFVLTNLLMPRILASPHPRIVNISSFGHYYCQPTWEDPHFRGPEKYNPAAAYAQSKGANILFAVALNERLGRTTNLKAYAAMPGDLGSAMYLHMDQEVLMDMAKKLTGGSVSEAQAAHAKTIEQGCAPGLAGVLSDELGDGVYIEHCKVTSDKKSVAPWALDPKEAETCWRVSEESVGEQFGY